MRMYPLKEVSSILRISGRQTVTPRVLRIVSFLVILSVSLAVVVPALLSLPGGSPGLRLDPSKAVLQSVLTLPTPHLSHSLSLARRPLARSLPSAPPCVCTSF